MEYVDLYDKNRKPLNRQKEKYSKFDEGEYMIIVHTCLFNNKGEMLIQQRALDKIDFPGKWDISSGGGVMAGEESSHAAERELEEELGIKVDLSNERVYLTIHYEKGFDDYYLVNCNLDINEFEYPKDELLNIKWASREEIFNMTNKGEFIEYKKGFIDLLFEMYINRGSYPKRG